MAAGTSCPELFSSILALANPHTNNALGMDTIAGSSVYNVLVIVGASAIAGARACAPSRAYFIPSASQRSALRRGLGVSGFLAPLPRPPPDAI